MAQAATLDRSVFGVVKSARGAPHHAVRGLLLLSTAARSHTARTRCPALHTTAAGAASQAGSRCRRAAAAATSEASSAASSSCCLSPRSQATVDGGEEKPYGLVRPQDVGRRARAHMCSPPSRARPPCAADLFACRRDAHGADGDTGGSRAGPASRSKRACLQCLLPSCFTLPQPTTPLCLAFTPPQPQSPDP